MSLRRRNTRTLYRYSPEFLGDDPARSRRAAVRRFLQEDAARRFGDRSLVLTELAGPAGDGGLGEPWCGIAVVLDAEGYETGFDYLLLDAAAEAWSTEWLACGHLPAWARDLSYLRMPRPLPRTLCRKLARLAEDAGYRLRRSLGRTYPAEDRWRGLERELAPRLVRPS